MDVKDLLVQAKALDKDGHYERVAKGILRQCNYADSDFKFVAQNGGRTMIKRKMFEVFLNQTTSI